MTELPEQASKDKPSLFSMAALLRASRQNSTIEIHCKPMNVDEFQNEPYLCKKPNGDESFECPGSSNREITSWMDWLIHLKIVSDPRELLNCKKEKKSSIVFLCLSFDIFITTVDMNLCCKLKSF